MFYWHNEEARHIGLFGLLFVASYAIYFIQKLSWPSIDTFDPYAHQYLNLSMTSAAPVVVVLLIFSIIYKWILKYQWAQLSILVTLLFWAFVVFVDGNYIVGLANWYSRVLISVNHGFD
jgi:hypothetical protein